MFIIGIDPGLTGGIAAFHDGLLEAVYDMPQRVKSVQRKRDKKTNKMVEKKSYEIDAEAVAGILHRYTSQSMSPNAIVCIEQVGAVYRADKKQGTDAFQPLHATFTFGQGYGTLLAAAGIYCGIENVHRIAPITWKKHFGLMKTKKDAARLYAIANIPGCEGVLQRKKDGGRADAILIGKYGFDNLEKLDVHNN